MLYLTQGLTLSKLLVLPAIMPAKNTVRYYLENSYYHIYNRGVEKRDIFLDEKDYKIFLYYLFIYISDPEIIKQYYPKLRRNLKNNNLYNQIHVIAFVLMPNHFHLLVHQNEIDATMKLMRRLTSAYTAYFNKRYKRVGPLLQGVFKAVQIDSDEYLLQISKYIHRNPLALSGNSTILETYPWSSFRNFVSNRTSIMVTPQFILDFFAKQYPHNDYKAFVLGSDEVLINQQYLLED